jgi:hypothetical protein
MGSVGFIFNNGGFIFKTLFSIWCLAPHRGIFFSVVNYIIDLVGYIIDFANYIINFPPFIIDFLNILST